METFTFTEPERLVFQPKEHITVAQWAEKYRMVSTGPTQGKWSNELTPYAVEPMATFNLPWVRKIYLEWAPQTGKTSVALNCLSYCIDIDPGPAMYIMPDEKVAKRISRRQLIPMFRNTPKLAELLSPRADDVTTLHVNFINGMDLMMAWASSAAALASESVRYLFFDEPGKYPEWTGKEADPFSLAEQRQIRYENTSKMMFFSTPNLDGDPFDTLLNKDPDEVRHYYARCPICREFQIMEFKQLHWLGCKDARKVRRKKMARYTCVKCGMDWDDYTRNRAVSLGRWKSDNPVERPVVVAFRGLASWYSPFSSLSTAATAFLVGQDDPKKLQAFVTQHQCRAWTERVETQKDSDLLNHKNEIPPGIVPAWAVALTAGIDVQKRGFWFVVRAWDGELNSHLVQYGYLSTFADVEAMVFQTSYQILGSDQTMAVWRAAMDTGGGESETEGITRTEEIYAFLISMRQKYGDRVIYGVKGAGKRQFQRVGPEKPIDSRPGGSGRSRRRWRGVLGLRMIDAFEMKKLLHWRLTRLDERVDNDGNTLPADSQRFYLHAETGIDYARQFLAEDLRRDRRGKYYWKQTARDNHLLDCEVYAAACADNSWQPNLTGLANYREAKTKRPADPPEKETVAEKVHNPLARRPLPVKPGGGWMNI